MAFPDQAAAATTGDTHPIQPPELRGGAVVTAQSEALRLADALDNPRGAPLFIEAAEELRRLHAANVDCMNHFNALMAERNDLLHALVTAMPFVEDAVDDEVYKSHRVHKVLGEIKAAIANAMGGAA